MSQIRERVKQRREYLRKKGIAYSLMTFVALFMVPCFVVALTLWGIAIYCLIARPHGYFFFTFMATFGALCISWLSWLLTLAVYDIHQEARQLPYVPRVTSDTLPNEEVLVRGAEEPASPQSEVLLRGAQGSGEMAEQELLRPNTQEEQRLYRESP